MSFTDGLTRLRDALGITPKAKIRIAGDFLTKVNLPSMMGRRDAAYDAAYKLAESDIFIDGALDLLESLHGKYNLYITSNGTAFVQDRRIEKTGLSRYFDGIFISERIGFNKPSREYFDACFDRMENKSREETIILGDSLTSDILGGINAGIHTCHITGGKNFEYSDIVPENSINTPLEFLGILEKIV